MPWLIAALLASAGFASLGFWQLGRAAYKEALLERHRAVVAADPIAWGEAEARLAMGETALPLRVRLSGRFDPARSVIHDHRVHEGRPGVHVLTLFRPAGGTMGVLVNLGWAADDRGTPSLPPLPEGDTAIAGLLAAPPQPGLRLAQAAWQPGAIPRLLHLDLSALAAQMGEKLAPAILLLDPEVPFGLLREWRPLPNTLPPERHRGYALQWFGLSATILVIAAILLRRPHA
jgi:cytochrome oxidase assembly protein ShyY1